MRKPKAFAPKNESKLSRLRYPHRPSVLITNTYCTVISTLLNPNTFKTHHQYIKLRILTILTFNSFFFLCFLKSHLSFIFRLRFIFNIFNYLPPLPFPYYVSPSLSSQTYSFFLSGQCGTFFPSQLKIFSWAWPPYSSNTHCHRKNTKPDRKKLASR